MKISAYDIGEKRMMIVPYGYVIYCGEKNLGQRCYIATALDKLNQQIDDGVYTCEPPRPEPEQEDTEND